MNRPIWLDQTLNIAVSRQFPEQNLADFAGILTSLGIRQAVIRLNERQHCCPQLTGLPNDMHYYGIFNLLEDELPIAEQVQVKKVMLTCVFPQRMDIMESIKTVIQETGRRGMEVTLVLEGSDSMSIAELSTVTSVIKECLVHDIIYRDKAGKENPFILFEKITRLKNSLECPVGIWAGNALGLATANTLAALKAGATRVMTSIGGIGGYAPWEEVLAAARLLWGIDMQLPDKLAIGCRQLFALLGLPVPANKAIIGPAIFAHESGLHVDGVTKDPEIYEPFAPEIVGLNRQLIVGKHSGTAALKAKFAAWGIYLKEEESKRLLAGVRSLAVRKRTAISDAELKNLYLSG